MAELESVLLADTITLLTRDMDPQRRGVRIVGAAVAVALGFAMIYLTMQTMAVAEKSEMYDTEGNVITDKDGLTVDLLEVLRHVMLLVACGLGFTVALNMIRFPRFLLSQVVTLVLITTISLILSQTIFASRQKVQKRVDDVEDKIQADIAEMQMEMESTDAADAAAKDDPAQSEGSGKHHTDGTDSSGMHGDSGMHDDHTLAPDPAGGTPAVGSFL